MGEHFSLEVDADLVAGAGRRLGRLGEDLRARAQQAGSAPGRWASGWSCQAATAVGEEATVLGGHLRGFARHFHSAAAAVSGFAEDLSHAVDVELVSLNRRWEATVSDYHSAVTRTDAAYRRSADELGADIPLSKRG